MTHINESPNLTKSSSGLLKDCWSICLSDFFSCFNSWLSSGNLPTVYNCKAMLLKDISASNFDEN